MPAPRKYFTEEERQEARKKSQRAYYERNVKKVKERARVHYENNRAEAIERSRVWRAANPGKDQEYKRNYYDANKRDVIERARRHYDANRDEVIKQVRRYQIANPGKRRAIARVASQRRRARASNQLGLQEVTAEVIGQRFGLFGHVCAYCGASGELHVDHFIPIAKGGSHAPENIVPACPSCNRRKNASEPEHWYRKQRSFTPERWSLLQSHTGPIPNVA